MIIGNSIWTAGLASIQKWALYSLYFPAFNKYVTSFVPKTQGGTADVLPPLLPSPGVRQIAYLQKQELFFNGPAVFPNQTLPGSLLVAMFRTDRNSFGNPLFITDGVAYPPWPSSLNTWIQLLDISETSGPPPETTMQVWMTANSQPTKTISIQNMANPNGIGGPPEYTDLYIMEIVDADTLTDSGYATGNTAYPTITLSDGMTLKGEIEVLSAPHVSTWQIFGMKFTLGGQSPIYIAFENKITGTQGGYHSRISKSSSISVHSARAGADG